MPFLIADAAMPYLFDNVAACKILRFITYFTALLSICTLLIISIERYRKICCPFKKQITLKVAKQLLVAVSIFSGLILSSPSALMYGHSTLYTGVGEIYGVGCFTDDSMRHSSFPFYYNIALFILLTCFGITMVYCYYRIAYQRFIRLKSRRTRNHISRDDSNVVLSSGYNQKDTKYSVVYKLKEELDDRVKKCSSVGKPGPGENTETAVAKIVRLKKCAKYPLSGSGVSTMNLNTDTTENGDAKTIETNNEEDDDCAIENMSNDEIMISTHVGKLHAIDSKCITDEPFINVMDSSAEQNLNESLVDNDNIKLGDGNTPDTEHLADENIDERDADVITTHKTESKLSIRCDSSCNETSDFKNEDKEVKHECESGVRNKLIRTESAGRKQTQSARPVVKKDRKLIRITKMLFVITAVYFISFTPHLVLMLVVLIDDNFLKSMNRTQAAFYYIVLRSFLINSVANPFILNYMDRKFQAHIRELWAYCRSKKAFFKH